MDIKDVVILDGARTPSGDFGGAYVDFWTYHLGQRIISACIDKTGIDRKRIGYYYLGHNRQAGYGSNAVRTAAILAGITDTPGVCINGAHGSGTNSILLGSQAIRAGDYEAVMVGGTESISNLPYFMKKVRWSGMRLGNVTLLDGIDELWDVPVLKTSEHPAEHFAAKHGISREEQDAYALESHKKAVQSWNNGWFADEVIPVEVPAHQGRGGFVLERDETIRPFLTVGDLATMKPAYKSDGTVTLANAAKLADGATGMIITSRARAQAWGLAPKASFLSISWVARGGHQEMYESVRVATDKAIERARIKLSDIDLIEIDEAYAAEVLALQKELELDPAKINVHGGSIALGYPPAAVAARNVWTLINALKTHDKEIGLAAVGGTGGVSHAIVVKREQ
ncbi:MAG: thiolase family protein [Chloroflexota bacterium]|nr:MAG: thiolase family protein [Chloroflexota bacterium]